ncbi:lysine histidine transporter-like 8 [Musa acuminata AAA Group]|uniref:lysine histidine transporter-like 8 n=1 Tax=Musa acuminata AAA Group TaxID=214697 RepID=UPI0031D47C49
MEERGMGTSQGLEPELVSIPASPRGASTPEAVTPTGQRSRGGEGEPVSAKSGTASPRFLSPSMSSALGTPMKRVLVNLRGYLEEVGHLTKLNPQDAWLPITESRHGNAHYAAFHNLNAGIGFQALLLPVAFAFLGWSWGIIALTVAYFWQLYTLWILVKLHEALPGRRYNRYVELAQAAFGERFGVWLALFPTIYLSAGTAAALILIGGETLKLFFQIVCGSLCSSNPLSTVEWYLVFTFLCIVLSQLPNLNSIAGLSLIGALTAITYTCMAWLLSVGQERPPSVSYQPLSSPSLGAAAYSVSNALGIIAYAFRGHNLALEIQATMPSTFKHPAHVPMWRGAKVAYLLIAMCFFPIAIGGFWAYGNLMPAGGILNALYAFHSRDISRGLLATTFLLVVFHCLTSFQIYSMPVFDSFEAGYTSRTNRPCSIWVRSGFRVFYGLISFFVGVALPFLSSLAGLLGGLSLPVTFAYPCFMWIRMKQPPRFSFDWYLNWSLGIVGMAFSLAFSVGGVWSMINSGIQLKFFKPN